jgi:hypothetical protein
VLVCFVATFLLILHKFVEIVLDYTLHETFNLALHKLLNHPLVFTLFFFCNVLQVALINQLSEAFLDCMSKQLDDGHSLLKSHEADLGPHSHYKVLEVSVVENFVFILEFNLLP